jgi:hypothetical protein
MSEQVRVIWGRFDELAARAQLSRIAVLDSVKQDVRRIDSSELQLVLTCCLT